MSVRRKDTVDDIRQLPSEIRSEVDRMVADYSYTYHRINEWLQAHGYEFRRRTIVLYSRELKNAALELIDNGR